MKENIIITDPEKLEKIKNAMTKDGAKKLHILADFDHTLTKAFINGEKNHAIIANLRLGNYLGHEFSQIEFECYKKYFPYENDLTLPMIERIKKMEEWWDEINAALVKYGLTKKIIEKMCIKYPLHLRPGAAELIEILNKKQVPLVIMSAAPADIITCYLEKNKLLHHNTQIVANWYEFDRNGKMIGAKNPIIHTLNKHEITLEHLPIFAELQKHPNVILLGNNLDDAGMVTGFNYKNLLKIGFLNEKIDELLPEFKKVYDVIITGDSDMNFVVELIKKILTS